MQTIRQIERLNEVELQKCIPPNASWHTDYRDTAYIHIGGLPFELSEGDVLTIFSQYGNPVHIHLARDKETGKSRGFAFLKYEDQRSCDLAVDNLSGAGVLGRVLGVDHCRYKLKEGEVEGEGLEDDGGEEEGDETDREGEGRRKRRRRSGSESEEGERPLIKEEVELARLMKEHDEDDPMREYMVQQKKEEVAEALKRLEVSKRDGKGRDRDGDRERRHHHRSRRHGSDDEDEDRRRNRHHSRREREKDDERKDGHRSRRMEDDDRGEKHRSRREEDDNERSRDHRRSRRDASSDEEYDRKRGERKLGRDRSAEDDSYRRGGRDRPRRDDSREDDARRRRD